MILIIFAIIFASNEVFSKEFCDSEGCFECPQWNRYDITTLTSYIPSDPLNLPRSLIEDWLTESVFNDLFPKANLGNGLIDSSPYSYKAFQIAARWFPKFGSESNHVNNRRDFAAFASHIIQEVGENDLSIYDSSALSSKRKDSCFFRGGLFNWFEGGPISSFISNSFSPSGGTSCNVGGKYCTENFLYPCNNVRVDEGYLGCYFGRGALQLSYNYNYGLFNLFLKSKSIDIDLLNSPNLLLTHSNPPLAILSALWFYMTPQPPKPSMHDIIIGNWKAGPSDVLKGYVGSVFGPTSLIINNECSGEESSDIPSSPGESRRIKAYKWLCEYFNISSHNDNEDTLSCKGMTDRFSTVKYKSYDADWSNLWKEGAPCKCKPAEYEGPFFYYDNEYFPSHSTKNKEEYKRCVIALYNGWHDLKPSTSPCLNTPLDVTSCRSNVMLTAN